MTRSPPAGAYPPDGTPTSAEMMVTSYTNGAGDDGGLDRTVTSALPSPMGSVHTSSEEEEDTSGHTTPPT